MSPATRRLPFPVLILLVVTVAFCIPSASVQSKEDKKYLKAQAEELLAKSHDLGNIEAPGSPPFVLKAKIHYQVGAQSADGQGQIIWMAPDHYREAYTAPNYFYTEIVRDGHRYLSRTNNEMPLVMFELKKAVHATIGTGVGVTNKRLKIKAVNMLQANDENLTCITFDAPAPITGCLDDSGDLATFQMERPRTQDMLGEHFEFSKFVTFGVKRSPQRTLFRGGDGHVIEIDVQQLAPVKEVLADAFQIPSDAMQEPWCAEPREPFSLAIDFNSEAERSLATAHAALYLVIGPNGHVRSGSVIRSSQPIKDKYLKTWMSSMRFPIRQCGSDGIEYQTEIQLGP